MQNQVPADSQMNAVNNQKRQMLSSSWAAKASTKYETYLLLVTEVKAYLPRLEHVTTYFLKEIISGKKKVVKQAVIRYLYVPQYEGLGLKEIYSHIDNDVQLGQYFPDLAKERARLPKQFIVNVLATLTGDSFENWVKDQVISRNLKRAREADKFIEVDKDIFDAFNAATSISLNKGSAHNMLQIGAKRRRTKAEKAKDDLAVQQKAQDNAEKLAQIEQLQEQLKTAQMEALVNQDANEILNKLGSKGIIEIDADCNVTIPATGELISEPLDS